MRLVSTPQAWDRLAGSYDADREKDIVYVGCIKESVRQVLKATPRSRVLDAGCGTGMATLSMSANFDRVVAADFSSSSLDALKQTKGASGIRAVNADLTRLGLATESFDAVLCHNVLQHLNPESQVLALAELIRVTKTGGRIVVTVHHYHLWRFLQNYVKEGKPGEPGVEYIFRFMPDELKRSFPPSVRARVELRSVGFRTAGVPGLSRLLSQERLNRWMGSWATRWHLGHMLMAILTK